MITRSHRLSAIVVAATLLFGISPVFAAGESTPRVPHYSLKDLGTLGGNFSTAYGINSRGSLTGVASLGETAADAFLWQKGAMTDLGRFEGAPLSIGGSVNDSDTVSGYANTSTPDPNGEDFCGDQTFLICLPSVWQKGVLTALPLLGGNNGLTGLGGGINNRGEIVGVSETPNTDPCSPNFLQIEAVIWRNGTVLELPPFPGDSVGFANAINDKGDAVGISGCVTTNTERAVLWKKNGTVIDLGNLGGTVGNIAFGINNRGQIVGQSDLAGDTVFHALLWQNGEMIDLGTLYGLPLSQANGINNKGQVVGFSYDANNSVAFLWQDGVLTDINTLIPPNSPMFLTEALDINDRGQIAGQGQLSDGDVHAYLLTPCDGEHCGTDAAGAAAPQMSSTVRGAAKRTLPQPLRRLMMSRYHPFGPARDQRN